MQHYPLLLAVVFVVLVLEQAYNGFCYQFKVGDLSAWGPPPPSNTQLYTYWSRNHNFSIGDSLLFLYPPSQDSVVQVTERAFNTCSISAASWIQKMDDGNSVFNITAPGYYYFTSGVPGRCQKLQKIAVAVPSANGTFFPPPADAPSGQLPADSPSASAYPVVFGPSAAQSSGSPVVGGAAAVVAAVVAGAMLWFL